MFDMKVCLQGTSRKALTSGFPPLLMALLGDDSTYGEMAVMAASKDLWSVEFVVKTADPYNLINCLENIACTSIVKEHDPVLFQELILRSLCYLPVPPTNGTEDQLGLADVVAGLCNSTCSNRYALLLVMDRIASLERTSGSVVEQVNNLIDTNKKNAKYFYEELSIQNYPAILNMMDDAIIALGGKGSILKDNDLTPYRVLH